MSCRGPASGRFTGDIQVLFLFFKTTWVCLVLEFVPLLGVLLKGAKRNTTILEGPLPFSMFTLRDPDIAGRLTQPK